MTSHGWITVTDDTDSLKPQTPDNITWMEVAQAGNGVEAEIIAGLLRTADIPTHIESLFNLPGVFFGQSAPGRVFVPAQYYEVALELLYDEDDEFPELDEPGIIP